MDVSQTILLSRKKIQELKESEPHTICYTRKYMLETIVSFLEKNGFPKSKKEWESLSIVPYIFQEANYDDISWSTTASDLEQLTDYFDIDYALFSKGKVRSKATAKEYAEYERAATRAIDHALKRSEKE